MDPIHYISATWDENKPDVIINCFQKSLDSKQADSSPLEEEDFQPLWNFADFATVNNELVTNNTLALDEIIADANFMENDEEEEDPDNPVLTPTITASSQHLSEIQKVLSSIENAKEMLCYVNKIENFLAERHCQNLKQTKIDTFFNTQ